ncbi:MAG: hypothetical protein QM831_39490 [Kofleriaceae bacterium]
MYVSIGHIEDPDDLSPLAQLPITQLTCAMTNLDDRGLHHICSIATLENLNIQATQVTDDGLAELVRLPALRSLRLKENHQLTNACVPSLVRCRHVEDLQIHETSIDEAALAMLRMLPLRELCLWVTDGNFTFDKLVEFSKRVPACAILCKGRGTFRDGAFEGTWR